MKDYIEIYKAATKYALIVIISDTRTVVYSDSKFLQFNQFHCSQLQCKSFNPTLEGHKAFTIYKYSGITHTSLVLGLKW